MLIDCPSCARSYHVSRAAIGETGRTVVCQICNTRWFVEPPAAEIEIAVLDDPPEKIAALWEGLESPAKTAEAGLSAEVCRLTRLFVHLRPIGIHRYGGVLRFIIYELRHSNYELPAGRVWRLKTPRAAIPLLIRAEALTPL